MFKNNFIIVGKRGEGINSSLSKILKENNKVKKFNVDIIYNVNKQRR